MISAWQLKHACLQDLPQSDASVRDELTEFHLLAGARNHAGAYFIDLQARSIMQRSSLIKRHILIKGHILIKEHILIKGHLAS